MTLRQRLQRLEVATGQAHGTDPLVIRTGVPRADDPHGLVAFKARVAAPRAEDQP